MPTEGSPVQLQQQQSSKLLSVSLFCCEFIGNKRY